MTRETTNKMNNFVDFLSFSMQNADVIMTDLASAIKQIFPTVPLKYIIRKVSPRKTDTHFQPLDAQAFLFFYWKPFIIYFSISRWKFNRPNVKQFFPMNCDHPIRVMLGHVVVLAHNTRVCVISTVCRTGMKWRFATAWKAINNSFDY